MMLKRIDFDYNGQMFGVPVNCEETTAEDLKIRKAQFKGLKDSMVLQADNELETLLAVYQTNRDRQGSREAIIDCLRKMAVVRA